MKRVVSISIGSSARDKSVTLEMLGDKYLVERIGTNGDMKKAIELIEELDGKVDVFGMGGIDIYLMGGSGRKHIIRGALPIKNAAKKTPMVDGTGLKNTLEGTIANFIVENNIMELKGKKVLITCAADRYKMAKSFVDVGCKVTLGDFAFALGIPLMLYDLKKFKKIADALIPIIALLPFSMLYPTGEKQHGDNSQKYAKYAKYYNEADIIAGDYHYIKKYMPERLDGKVIVTNTVTEEDVRLLKSKGVQLLITTTPDFEGRSFGTNVLEALLVSASGKCPQDITDNDYFTLLNKLDLKPRVENLSEGGTKRNEIKSIY